MLLRHPLFCCMHWISHQRICNSYADIPCIFHHTRQDGYRHRLPHRMNSSFPQCVCVCAYHYYTECAHSIGIRVNRREERLINLSPRRLESGHVRFFFARLLDTSAESQNLPGLELSTYLEGFPLPSSKANASSLVLMSTSSARSRGSRNQLLLHSRQTDGTVISPPLMFISVKKDSRSSIKTPHSGTTLTRHQKKVRGLKTSGGPPNPNTV